MSILRPGCEDHHHERRRQPSSRSFPEADRESGGCMVINRLMEKAAARAISERSGPHRGVPACI
jgi:hypothetical protein